MMVARQTIKGLFLLCAAFVAGCIASRAAEAGVILHDEVGTEQHCRLSAVTTGRFFPAGGRIVSFMIDGKSIGKTMSGGDGYAFMQCTGLKPGLHKVTASSGDDSARGLLLITDRARKVLLLHIDDRLLGSIFQSGKDDSNPGALKGMTIVYATSLPSERMVHKLLGEKGYPDAPVIDWADGAALRELAGKGISIHGMVAPPAVLEGVEGVERKFSFEDTPDAETIKNWDDLRKKMVI